VTPAAWRMLMLGAAALSPPMLAPVAAEAQVWRLHQPHVLGASLDLAVVTPDPAVALTAARAARAEIDRLDAVLSRWRPDSDLSRGRPSAELEAVIAAAEGWRGASGGAFDARRGASFDLDGVAKGHVIDQALWAARRTPGVEGLMLDIGGDLRVWGRSPSPGGWRVGVADPSRLQDNAEPAQVLRLTDGAVAFSGPGLRGPHVLRPDGTPSLVSAAAFAPTARDADALSTALCAMPAGEGLALVERLAGFEALVIDAEGRRRASPGWSALAEPRLILAQAPSAWPPGFGLTLDYEIPRQTNGLAQPPYLVAWVTDAAGTPLRTLIMMGKDERFIDQNFIWWRRVGRALGGAVDALAKPTRRPGRYSLTWDGRDEKGRTAPQGRYTVHIEAAREHGGHGYQTFDVTLGAQAVSQDTPGNGELGPATVRYGPAN
jgi:thiamine biosynthesis lipoprotein